MSKLHINFEKFGDFYEVIGDNAEPVAKALGIVVTSRKGVPMTGVPHHRIWSDCAALQAMGHEVTVQGKVPE